MCQKLIWQGKLQNTVLCELRMCELRMLPQSSHSQYLLLIAQLKCMDDLGVLLTNSAFGTCNPLICLSVKQVRSAIPYSRSSPRSGRVSINFAHITTQMQHCACLSSADANLRCICTTLKVNAANPYTKACPATDSVGAV